VRDCESASPISIAAGKYVVVIASERQKVPFGSKAARAWIDAGASYICSWGPDSANVEEAFDDASFLPELGEPFGTGLQRKPCGSPSTTQRLPMTLITS
jgi:hypothetical protein